MTTAAQAFVHRVADEVGRRERNFQRAIGATWTDVYAADWHAWRDVVDIAASPDRPAFYEAPRMISNPNSRPACDHSVSRARYQKHCTSCGATIPNPITRR